MDWLAAERARLRNLMVAALEQLIDGYDGTLAPTQRLELAQRAISLDPYREQAHRQLLHALVQLGRRNDAVAHYRQLERTLQTELGVEPERATRELFDSVRSGAVGPIDAASARRRGRSNLQDIPHHPEAHEKPAIAVLPFANLSDDLQQGYLSDGVTEDIITELSRFQQIRDRPAQHRVLGSAMRTST